MITYANVCEKDNFLGRLSKKLNLATKITIYNSMIAPHFEYGVVRNWSRCYYYRKTAKSIKSSYANFYFRKTEMLDALQCLSLQQRTNLKFC